MHSRLGIPVLGYWKNEDCFPYLKAVARELQGMTATLALSERVLAMQANRTV